MVDVLTIGAIQVRFPFLSFSIEITSLISWHLKTFTTRKKQTLTPIDEFYHKNARKEFKVLDSMQKATASPWGWASQSYLFREVHLSSPGDEGVVA